LDPLTRELFDAAADGTIRGRLLDVGAGRGQFSAFLAELGAVDSIVGFDHDAAKIDVAAGSAITWPVPAEFNVGDLRAQPMPLSDTILLLDVLHYLNTLEQDAVLGRAVSALRPGGHLFLRETNRGSGAGSFLAGQLERLARFLGVNRGERLMFRAPDEYVGTLTQLGLEVRTLGGRGALDNVLLIASHTDSSR
jgi:2-polyprenyl-3-methyl-5-hydroxy-6-metoxy-1,4-benzoquinol methylase